MPSLLDPLHWVFIIHQHALGFQRDFTWLKGLSIRYEFIFSFPYRPPVGYDPHFKEDITRNDIWMGGFSITSPPLYDSIVWDVVGHQAHLGSEPTCFHMITVKESVLNRFLCSLANGAHQIMNAKLKDLRKDLTGIKLHFWGQRTVFRTSFT